MLHEALPTITARFLVGQDCHGFWIVRDRLGRIGGLFASESAALHFAREEAGHDPRQVRCVSDGTLPELHADFETLPQRAARPVNR